MKWLESRWLWGSLLILAGVLLLLQSLGVLPFGDLFWGLFLSLGGVFFFYTYFRNRDNWWALVPGFTLVSVALVVILDRLEPGLMDIWGGSLVLGGIGISFLVIYLLERELWWTIIPAGVMLTLALVVALDELAPGLETAGVLFLGMGATFGVLALTARPNNQMRWAWIPAAILVVMGLIMVTAFGNLMVYLWPLALLLAGGYLIWRAMRAN